MAKMTRTTIMAHPELLEQLRRIAKEEGISLGEAVRQGLEWRVNARRRPPSFIGAVASDGTQDASRDEETIMEFVREKDERERAERAAGL